MTDAHILQEDLDRRLHEAVVALNLEKASSLCALGARADRFFGNDHALFIALFQERLDFLRLLAPRADATLTDERGATPLMVAAQNESLESVEILLPLSNPHAADQSGSTALLWLLRHGDPTQKQSPRRISNRLNIFRLFAQVDPVLLEREIPRAPIPFAQELALVVAESQARILEAVCAISREAKAPPRI